MTTNPFINAVAAMAYITLVATFMFYGPGKSVQVDGLIVPIFMLSLFVLSAAMMGCFFLLRPVQLLVEGKQAEATKLFLTTIFAFALITVVLVAIWYLLSLAL